MEPLEEEIRDSIAEMFDAFKKNEERKLELYEKRTYVLERIAMALEHRNEKQFHSVR